MRSTFEPIDTASAIARCYCVACAAVLIVMVALTACGLSPRGGALAEVHARGSLDMVREFVDPAYELAVRACKDQQTAVYLAALDGGDMKAARGKLESIQARCKRATDAFDEIREWHDAASALVEDGRVDDAEHLIDQIKEALRTLLERTNAP